MQLSNVLLSFTILWVIPLQSMHIAHVAKKTPHTRSLHKRVYATQKQNLNSNELKKEESQTIISYKGKTYTPAALAQHVVGKAVSRGIDYIDSWKKAEVECKCMLPYTCISNNMELFSALENYQESISRLDHAIKYLEKSNIAVAQELNSIKTGTCPHLYTCFKKIHFQENRETYLAGVKSTVLIISFFTACGGSFFGVLFSSMVGTSILSTIWEKRTKDRFLTIHEKAIRRHFYEEAQKIERALKKAEPVILAKSVTSEQKYLPLPTNEQNKTL